MVFAVIQRVQVDVVEVNGAGRSVPGVPARLSDDPTERPNRRSGRGISQAYVHIMPPAPPVLCAQCDLNTMLFCTAHKCRRDPSAPSLRHPRWPATRTVHYQRPALPHLCPRVLSSHFTGGLILRSLASRACFAVWPPLSRVDALPGNTVRAVRYAGWFCSLIAPSAGPGTEFQTMPRGVAGISEMMQDDPRPFAQFTPMGKYL